MDNNGIPTIEHGYGVFADSDTQNAIRSVETPQVSIGAVCESILSQAPTATNLCIDPYARRIYAGPDGLMSNAVLLQEVNPVKTLVLGPVAGQSGRSLQWEEKSMDSGFPATVEAIADALLAAATPKRSVESLAAAILGAVPADTADADVPMLYLDQGTGKLTACICTNRTTDNATIKAFVEGNGGYVGTLSEPPAEDDGPDPLIFEGGSTGA